MFNPRSTPIQPKKYLSLICVHLMLVHVSPLALFSSSVLLCLSMFFTIFYYLLQETEHDLQRPRPTSMDKWTYRHGQPPQIQFCGRFMLWTQVWGTWFCWNGIPEISRARPGPWILDILLLTQLGQTSKLGTNGQPTPKFLSCSP